ncbi:MAG: Hpt domain-containing protein [Planctomycetes bacterium]|nr:Hpt domain-containing protein [Planctomycetota bacterium]
MIELVEEFVGNLPVRLAAIEQAVQADNLAELTRHAHQLKGAGGGHGFDVISLAAAELESAAKAARTAEEVRTQVDQLVVLCHRATATPSP